MVGIKRCTICNIEKKVTEFSKNKYSSSGLRPDCKECGKLTIDDRCELRIKNKVIKHTKKCNDCGVEKLLKEFPSRDSKGGVCPYCKGCYVIRNKINKQKHGYYKEYEQKRYANNPEKRALEYFKSDLKKNYGLSYDKYMSLLKKQDNKCAICKKETSENNKKLHVDHCHKTGAIRGILCRSCNHGIGNFKDKVELLKRAISYLNGELIYED